MDSVTAPDGASFSLLETMRLEHGRVERLERHLARMAEGARYFGYTWNETAVREAVASTAAAHPDGWWRVRLLLSPRGARRSNARRTRRKRARGASTSRASQSMPQIRSCSTRRLIVWSTRSRGNREPRSTMCCCGMSAAKSPSPRSPTSWPRSTASAIHRPCHPGLLAGTFRAELLAAGTIRERVLTKADVASASRLWLINSVRGWVDASLISSGHG